MSRKKKVLLSGVGLAVALAVAAVGGWYFFVRSSAPPPPTLENAAAAVGSKGQQANAQNLAGTWKIDPSNSFVGYRVNEQLVGIGANTAVGRTSSLDGTLECDGTQITSVQVTADLTALKSDKPQRDGALRTQGLQTGRFPNATFALTAPIVLGGPPADGATIDKTIEGDLTLHGVTKHVQLDVQGQMKGGQAIIVGSVPINFADFDMQPPKAGPVLGVEDHGLMELQLVFAKAVS